MLDIGLLVTGAVLVVVLVVGTRWAPTASFEPGEVLDRLIVPAVVGLLSARVATAALDDWASLRSVRALLVIRGGVEFWVGVAVMVALVAWTLRRRHRPASVGLAELAPFALWGYAAYEATCVVRDECYGPVSPVGLVPGGLSTRMFPLGLIVAAAVAALGFAVRHVPWSATARLLLAVGGVAGLRSLVSFWLPKLGEGLTRQHVESIVVAATVLVVGAGRLARAGFAGRRSGRPRVEPRAGMDGAPLAPDVDGGRV